MGLKIGDQVCIGGNKVKCIYFHSVYVMFIDVKLISDLQNAARFLPVSYHQKILVP